VPGAAFASGTAATCELRCQARGNTRAVEGMKSLVIEFRDDRDRSIEEHFRDVLVASKEAAV
jgi:hypothetical protein